MFIIKTISCRECFQPVDTSYVYLREFTVVTRLDPPNRNILFHFSKALLISTLFFFSPSLSFFAFISVYNIFGIELRYLQLYYIVNDLQLIYSLLSHCGVIVDR